MTIHNINCDTPTCETQSSSIDLLRCITDTYTINSSQSWEQQIKPLLEGGDTYMNFELSLDSRPLSQLRVAWNRG